MMKFYSLQRVEASHIIDVHYGHVLTHCIHTESVPIPIVRQEVTIEPVLLDRMAMEEDPTIKLSAEAVLEVLSISCHV